MPEIILAQMRPGYGKRDTGKRSNSRADKEIPKEGIFNVDENDCWILGGKKPMEHFSSSPIRVTHSTPKLKTR